MSNPQDLNKVEITAITAYMMKTSYDSFILLELAKLLDQKNRDFWTSMLTTRSQLFIQSSNCNLAYKIYCCSIKLSSWNSCSSERIFSDNDVHATF